MSDRLHNAGWPHKRKVAPYTIQVKPSYRLAMLNSVTNFFSLLRRATRESGRSIPALLWEMLALRAATGRIRPAEYFNYRLHLNDLTLREKRRFGGALAFFVLYDIMVDDYSYFLHMDKVTMYTLLAGYGFPIPELRAVYGTQRPAVHCLNSPQELERYLSSSRSLPVFLKPSAGGFARGCTLIEGLADGSLRLGNDTTIPIQSFCQSLDDRRGLGWILQEPLTPHASIAELCGPKISGVRIHTFGSGDGPQILNALWKINAGGNDFDNFLRGKNGNMAGEIDCDTGEILRVVSGVGFDQTIDPCHPLSGKRLTGFRLPHWGAVKKLVTEVHLAFPGSICQCWDVAICEEGPRIVEVNFCGAWESWQHAAHRGFMDERFLKLLSDRGLEHLLRSRTAGRRRLNANGRIGRRKSHWKW